MTSAVRFAALSCAAVLALPLPSRADPMTFTLSATGTAAGGGDRFGVFGSGEPATFQLTVGYDSARVREEGAGGSAYGPASLTVTSAHHSLTILSAPFDAEVHWSTLGSTGWPRYRQDLDVSYWFINGSVEVIELGLTLEWNDARIAPFTLAQPGMLVTGGDVAAFFRINQTLAGERVGYLDFATDAWTLSSAAAIPEPAEYALLLAGLAVVGLAQRRVRRPH